jgi:erythromycin esterase
MSQPPPAHATLDDWIAREALPFSLAAPDTFAAAVAAVIAALGDATALLGLGEPLHGGEEFLILRNRLFQRLVEAHGYTAIALESSFPRAHVVDEYIAGRGSSYEAVRDAGFSHGFGQLDANRELVGWMRRYNADPAHRVPLRFYGCDSPTEMTGTDSPRRPLMFALDYLASVDATGDQGRRGRVAALLGRDAGWENPAALMDPAQAVGASPEAAALRIETEELLSELRVRRPELAPGDEGRYVEAVQHAAVARQLLNYHAALARTSDDRIVELLGIREALMADNLAYTVARERDRGKVLVHAHNGHLQRGQLRWQLGPNDLRYWPAGAHLDSMFGPRYAAIGTGVGISDANGIGRPEADTLEARLIAAPGPGRFVPTHRGYGLPAAALAALPTRSGSARNPGYFALTPGSLADFDWLAVLDAATYTRGGPPLPQR